MSRDKLAAIFAETLEIPLTDVMDTLASGVAETWPSIAHIALIAIIRHRRVFKRRLSRAA